jgi:hypothetical protein
MVLVTGIDTAVWATPLIVDWTVTLKGLCGTVTPLTSRLQDVTLAVVSRVITPFCRSADVKAIADSLVRTVPLTFQVANVALGNMASALPMKVSGLTMVPGATVILMSTLLVAGVGVLLPPPPFLQEVMPVNKDTAKTAKEMLFITEVFMKFSKANLMGSCQKNNTGKVWVFSTEFSVDAEQLWTFSSFDTIFGNYVLSLPPIFYYEKTFVKYDPIFVDAVGRISPAVIAIG